ncbi:LOW QUALITY PROTEIN: hypothetical protein RJ639_044020 [Escallonia herrerae]|uniref:Delta(3)-Delta(2)-enoyl-CoA isomerase n=1 Tax=Escallonia herrerae TaxID=1293975 RepID=A0AA89B3Z0_9ASTE|nr:LOW QUALITY PROTEIN: hypothetical protein RJ639_044020 [Escallonia herrerae]
MCTIEKGGSLSLTGDGDGDEHRLNPTLIAFIRSCLAQAGSEATRGAALITGKFFSNGFDLNWAQAAGSKSAAADRLLHMLDLFKPVVADLMALRMPTIAAVTGHAAAAGMMLAMSHDYVLMRGDRGVMYMSELDIGMTLPDYFTALVRAKVANPAARRDVLLRAVRSAHGGSEETVEAAVRLGEELGQRRWDGEVYGEIRKALYPELCGVLGLASKANPSEEEDDPKSSSQL